LLKNSIAISGIFLHFFFRIFQAAKALIAPPAIICAVSPPTGTEGGPGGAGAFDTTIRL